MNYFKINDLFYLIRNGANIKQTSDKSGIPITRIETIVDNKIDYNRVGYADIFDNQYQGYYLSNGDILMSHINSVSHLGKVGLVENIDKNVIHGMNLLVLKTKLNLAFPKYLYYYFTCTDFKIKLIPITKKSINQASFNIKDLKEVEIPLPSYEDQIKIANLLERIENLITERQNTIDLLNELVKATFHQMFGDPVKNEKGWNKYEIKEIGKIITGNTPKRNIIEYYNSTYIEWIKTDNIDSKKVYLTNSAEYLSEKGLKVGRYVNKNALLINCIAGSLKSIGKVALANRKVAFNQQINAIEFNSNIDSLFMYWHFKISENYIQSFASGAMKYILSKTEFEKIKITVPSYKLQNKFATIAQKIESIKAEQEAQKKVMEELYASITRKVFNEDDFDLSRVPFDASLLPKKEDLIVIKKEVYNKKSYSKKK